MVRVATRIVSVVGLLLFALSAAAVPVAFAQWVEQGPGPIFLNGHNMNIPPNSPATGATNAMAIDPSDPTDNTVYAGTANGGIWKTTNFMTADPAGPQWTPLTDQQLPALSINSLAVSPLDPNIVFAGTGSTSSFAFDGSPGFGIARSTDGGATWTVLAPTTFEGRRINSIVPTVLTTGTGQVVLASTLFDRGGVFRSADGGMSFARLSGTTGSGLPDGGASSVIPDPRDPNRFYAGVPSEFGAGASAGVYVSNDGGQTWTVANNGLTDLGTSRRLLLSIHSTATDNVVYVMNINTAGTLAGVFRSPNQGGSWTALSVPTPPLFPGASGIFFGAIAAHPADPNVVFVAGERQDQPFPNANGCTDFTAIVYRGDAALLPGNPWANVVCAGANGTSPHPDARAMRFDVNGNLVLGSDGGIYRLNDPDNAAGGRRWTSLNGNLRSVEIHSATYDPVSKIIFAGTQDNGSPMQNAPGSFSATDFTSGDGGVVAVDTDQTTHPGLSIRYTSRQFFGFFNRSSWDAANNLVSGPTQLRLRITSGSGSGRTLFQFDPNIQFFNPYVLNAIDPARMLIGTANIYESTDRGDSLANLGFTGQFISALAYGSRLNGVSTPDVFYVSGFANRSSPTPKILHRVNAGGPITTLTAYPGTSVLSLAMDPQNYKKLYVVDDQSRVWGSFNEGASWIDLTANLPILCPDVRSIAIFSPDAGIKNTVLIVGGLGGVFQMRRPGAAGASWTPLGTGFPHGLVLDLHYDYTDDVLVAGILGRGAWTLTRFFRGDGGPGLPPSTTQPTDRPLSVPDVFPPVPSIPAIQPPATTPMIP